MGRIRATFKRFVPLLVVAADGSTEVLGRLAATIVDVLVISVDGARNWCGVSVAGAWKVVRREESVNGAS